MTKEEIETHFDDICNYLQRESVNMPKTYIGRISVMHTESYLDPDFTIDIDNSKGFKVTFSDGRQHQTRLTPWNGKEMSLEFKVELLHKWPIVKSDLRRLVIKRVEEANRDADAKAAKEKALCDSITEFEL